jgi:hypothetical protein
VRTPTRGKCGVGARHTVSNRREAWKLTTSNLSASGERSNQHLDPQEIYLPVVAPPHPGRRSITPVGGRCVGQRHRIKLVRADSWLIGGPFKEKPRVKRGSCKPIFNWCEPCRQSIPRSAPALVAARSHSSAKIRQCRCRKPRATGATMGSGSTRVPKRLMIRWSTVKNANSGGGGRV